MISVITVIPYDDWYISLRSPVTVGGYISTEAFQIRPKKAGKRCILVDVDCKQLKDLKSSQDVFIHTQWYVSKVESLNNQGNAHQELFDIR